MIPDDNRDTRTFLFDGPDYWVVYPTAYWEAAELVLDMARSNSFLVHPGMFLLRHYVELTFKELIHGSGTNVPVTHDLTALWRDAREMPNIRENRHAKAEVLDPITSFVAELVEIDRTSFTFRYPVDTKGEPRGLGGAYSAKQLLEWARALHQAFATLEGAIEIHAVEGQFEAEIRREYEP